MTKYKKITFLFPGQGAQYVGMGKDFCEQYPIACHTFEEAEETLGRKLIKLVQEGPEAELTETHNSQVAIYVTSVALLRVLQELFPHIKPAACAGLSLGEYTALHASHRMGFAECLSLVQLRGQYMSDACEANKGTMAVIMGMTPEAVTTMVKELNLPHDLWAANFNCPGQVVISGTLKGIQEGSKAALERGAKRVLPLQVHGAFHSGLMKLAEERLTPYIREISLKESKVQLVMNVPGAPVQDLNQIKSNLIKQVTSSVKWEQGIRTLASEGCDLFIEIGCGKVLSGFNKRIGIEVPTLSLEKIADLELF